MTRQKRAKFSINDLRDSFKKEELTGEKTESKWLKFFRIETGQSMTVRILPDKDSDNNPLQFAIETKSHRLPTADGQTTIPCLKDHGADCPICDAAQAYYAEENEDAGRKLYRSLQHVVQCIVVESPDQDQVGKLFYMSLNKSIFSIIRAAIADEELEAPFYDFDDGVDFKIIKTQNGEYASYTTSKFMRKSRAVTDAEYEVYEADGVALETLRHAKPELSDVEDALVVAQDQIN